MQQFQEERACGLTDFACNFVWITDLEDNFKFHVPAFRSVVDLDYADFLTGYWTQHILTIKM